MNQVAQGTTGTMSLSIICFIIGSFASKPVRRVARYPAGFLKNFSKGGGNFLLNSYLVLYPWNCSPP